MKNFLNNQLGAADSVLRMNRKMQEANAEEQAKLLGLPYVNFNSLPADLNAMSIFSRQEAEQYKAVPFSKEGSSVRIAAVDPKNEAFSAKLTELGSKYQIQLYVMSSASLAYALTFYKNIVTPKEHQEDIIRLEAKDGYAKELRSFSGGADRVTDLLAMAFASAMELSASDIHFESEEHQVKVRLRIDGVLQDMVLLDKSLQNPLISRIKILTHLKLNVTNLPQDGRLTFYWGNEAIDVRLSTLPSSFGEGVVLRLLGVGAARLEIHELGLVGRSEKVIEEVLQRPNGMVITTGPTGSGKTTTLYSFLMELNDPGLKIITIEDPVEYKLEGIQQTPIDSRVQFGFARALRAILRQDPDIVMVGEIRDAETAETALQAALTGHIVLSTLHTNDSFGAIPRLSSMGMKPFIMAPAINAVIAQRLVRKLCNVCKKETTLSPELEERVEKLLKSIPPEAEVQVPEKRVYFKAPGCDSCHLTGYKGRIGIYEVIAINDAMKELILKEASMLEMKQQALKDGTLLMAQDGLIKAMLGITDVEEVFRVAGD